jgi:nitrile hydratase
MIVCTLCSCYPWTILGLPPTWYKSPEYRARVVIEPRTVLAEFGAHLSELTEIRVWDSNAETRYMVLPRRPAHTEGWSIDDLVSVVTRDAMVGAGVIADPAEQQTRP